MLIGNFQFTVNFFQVYISCPSEKPYPDEKLKLRLMNFLIC